MNANQTESSAELFDRAFVEQAEYLEANDLLRWSAQHPREAELIRKLTGGGAKLITGPRGCGKTTLMLKAYHQMHERGASASFAVYVNYKASLKLEPLYTERSSASYWFKQWILAKIYIGLYESLAEKNSELGSKLGVTEKSVKSLASRLELGVTPGPEQTAIELDQLKADIDTTIEALGRPRCVLLLDDAAHAFSADQQRDFFELFRQIKSRSVAPKAAIYPGVTVYSPGFQVGHDAEEVDVWIDPYSTEYLGFMKDLIEKRIPTHIYRALQGKPDYLTLVCFAAFGMPRALLNMVRQFYGSDSDDGTDSNIDFSFRKIVQAIRGCHENTLGVFEALRLKLPVYDNFVREGKLILNVAYDGVKTYNKGKPKNSQSVTLAVSDDLAREVRHVFGFLQYAGMMRFAGKVSRGEKGNFDLFRLHAAGLISNNALFGDKAINATNYVYSFTHLSAHAFTRIGEQALLQGKGVSECLSLALPPCESCGSPRLSPEAKFCGSCGRPLKESSIYKRLLQQPISVLPMTETRVRRIQEHSRIRTIKDIIIDHDGKELLGVPRIGPFWARQIQSYADEFIS